MTATLLDILMILSLGILAGTGTGLVIGFCAKTQKHDWDAMQRKGRDITILLILSCSIIFIAVLAWYIFLYPEM